MTTAVTMESFVHSHYANDRGLALMVVGAGLLGMGLGGLFLSKAHYDSDLQMGLTLVGASLLTTAVGALWWHLRRDPTRTGMYQKLVGEAGRILWVYQTTRSCYFYRDDAEVLRIPLTWPGPSRFGARELATLFAATYPRAMHGETDENSRRYFASVDVARLRA